MHRSRRRARKNRIRATYHSGHSEYHEHLGQVAALSWEQNRCLGGRPAGGTCCCFQVDLDGWKIRVPAILLHVLFVRQGGAFCFCPGEPAWAMPGQARGWVELTA